MAMVLAQQPTNSCDYFVHWKGILPSAATTSLPSLRDEDEVSITVEEARVVAGLVGGQVLGSLHAGGRRIIEPQPLQRRHQQLEIVSDCIRAAEGQNRLFYLLQAIFQRSSHQWLFLPTYSPTPPPQGDNARS